MDFKPKEKLRVAVLLDEYFRPPESLDGLSDTRILELQNEYDVITTLRGMGHEVRVIGLKNDVRLIRTEIEEFHPEIVFNLVVELHGYSMFEGHVVSYLELLKQPYTGCNPRGLTLAHDKALSKQILTYHRIPVPAFTVYMKGRKIRAPRKLKFPVFVKSRVEHGSLGISQASVVRDEQALIERVEFIHRSVKSHALVEEYIEGREFYVAVLGNDRLQTFTPWELIIENLPPGAPYIATGKMKWNLEYRKKVGLKTNPADLSPEIRKRIDAISKRAYRALHLSGYARLDFRMNEKEELFLLEANPNPDISYGEDFAEAAHHSGLEYEPLLQKILTLGIQYSPTS